MVAAGPGRILRLAGSALVVLVAEPLYLLLDLAVVGRLGAADLAALTVGALLLSVVSTQLTFLSYGTTARSARRFGAGDRPGAVAEGVQASWIAIGVGLLIVVVMQLAGPAVLSALTGDDALARSATGWLRIAVCGVPFILLSMAGNGWMRGVQDTRRPIVFVSAGFAISAMLCPLLVHGLLGVPRLGLAGSGWANLIGQGIAGVAFVARVIRENAAAGDEASIRPQQSMITAQLRLGRDLIVRSLSFQVCFLSAAAVASRVGVAAVAAHQTVLQVWNFLSLVLDSLAIAAQALVGAALGARVRIGDLADRDATAVAARVTRLSLGLAVSLAVVLAAGHSLLPRIFTTDDAVLDAIAVPWWFLVVMLPLAGVVFALDGVLLGGGDAAYLRTTTLGAALIGFLPLIWLSLIFDWGLAGIWSGVTVFIALRLVALLARMRSGRWTAIELSK
jgi:putative MATE family efflux protein